VRDLRLDDEQQQRVRDCLTKASVALPREAFGRLIAELESSIHQFQAAEPQATLRETRDALRAIWTLARADDPSAALLRGRLRSLPKRALDYIDDRAVRVIPRLFPGEQAESGFLAWADTVDGKKLIEAAAVVSAQGARVVPGRSRGSGKRSRRQLEPLILGAVRGAEDGQPKGGRPRAGARDGLVRRLALDWYVGAEQMPNVGRSDYGGFGDLVHSIFDWLSQPGAAQALRRYWAEVEKGRTRLALQNREAADLDGDSSEA
jgi:hypothetical protein